MQALLTSHKSLDIIHKNADIIHKTMNHTQGLCNSQANLVLGQSIQSLESFLYLSLPRQFISDLPCGTLSHAATDNIYNSTLTEPPLLNFFCRQGKY
jgi:hypothetical protein